MANTLRNQQPKEKGTDLFFYSNFLVGAAFEWLDLALTGQRKSGQIYFPALIRAESSTGFQQSMEGKTTPRVGRVVLPNYPHPIVQRGHNRQVVFVEPGKGDRFIFLL